MNNKNKSKYLLAAIVVTVLSMTLAVSIATASSVPPAANLQSKPNNLQPASKGIDLQPATTKSLQGN